MDGVSPDHPRIALLCAFDGIPTNELADAMSDAAEDLAASRSWFVSGPTFVDEDDAERVDPTDPEDDPIRTVGVYIEVYSGFPPWGERLPVEVDARQLEDARALIDRMIALSRETGHSIVVEYDGEEIGSIVNGTMTRGLEEGLLQEWARDIEQRRG
jgi:hypothetical protein